jgi:hypothetical protein
MATNQKIELVKGGQKVDDVFVPKTPATAPVITPSSLEPTTAFNLPTPPVPTGQTALMADFEVQDEFTQALTDSKKTAETAKTNSLDAYIKQLQESKGLTQLTADEYAKDGGVDSITPELNDINDKIRKEQLALRRATERIEKVGGGLASGATAEISNLERDSFAKQADLSIIQMAAQGKYDSAKEIADRAVAAKLEQQNIYNETLKFAYEENKDLFTTAEQREFETLLGNRERKLTEEKERQTAIYDLALQAQADGAPTSVVQQMMKAKTREEAMGAGGSYIGALDRQMKQANIAQSYASIANINSQIADRQAQTNEMGTLNGKPQNVTQASANGYADRIAQANSSLSLLGNKFTGTLAIGGALPNWLQSGDRQAFEQAKNNFATAVLRRESGASIAPTEFATLEKTYFPMPGDDEQVLQQKEELRNTVINSFYREANVPRPVIAGDVIEADDGTKYRVGLDGETLEPIE